MLVLGVLGWSLRHRLRTLTQAATLSLWAAPVFALPAFFLVGLAGVLTAIGLIMVYAGKLLERLPIRHTAVTARFLPMASATFITLAGLLITLRALAEAGVL